MASMKRRNEVKLKEAIDHLLDAYKLRGRLSENRLIQSWEKIMGKVIARHTSNIYLKENRLFVKLNSSVLRSELSYAKGKIIVRINEEIGQNLVKDIVFT